MFCSLCCVVDKSNTHAFPFSMFPNAMPPLSSPASSECKQCVAGKYNNQLAQVMCVSCTVAGAQKYQSKIGQVSCDTCSDGLKPTNIADACTCVDPCPSGKYGKVPECNKCPAGKYYVALGAKQESDCSGCPIGTWSTIEGANSSATCEGCPKGKKGILSGQATVAAGCKTCIAGENYQDETGQVTCLPAVCGKGKYASSSSPDVTKARGCTDCPTGTYGPVPGLDEVGNCNACSAGKYGITVGANSPDTCIKCPAGRYEDSEKQTECKECPGNSASGQGAVRCGNCFAGRYLAPTQTGTAECTDCPIGKYSKPEAAECILCEQGKSSRSGDPICTACQPGTYRGGTAVNGSGGECLACAAGRISAAEASVCAPCAAGQYLASTNGSQCEVRSK
jgi:hypothetical protein